MKASINHKVVFLHRNRIKIYPLENIRFNVICAANSLTHLHTHTRYLFVIRIIYEAISSSSYFNSMKSTKNNIKKQANFRPCAVRSLNSPP